jgi:hypothetical protein
MCSCEVLGFNCDFLLFLLISLSPVETASFLSHMAVLTYTLTNLGVLIKDNDGIRRRDTQIEDITGL